MTFTLLFMVLIILPQSYLCYVEWKISNITLPRPDYSMAIAYYNKSVYLVGGYDNRDKLVQYDIDENLFFDQTIPSDTWSSGQYYSQSANMLYIIDFDYNNDDMLAVFNLEKKEFDNYWKIQINIGDGACIASTNEYIFIVGGGNLDNYDGYLDTLQVFNLSSYQWINNTLKLNEKRGGHSCIVHSSTNTLYSIGGQNDLPSSINDDRMYINGKLFTPLHSIEQISTINIQTQTWNYNLYNLTSPSTLTRCTIHENSIFVIGGWGPSMSNMHIIDVQTGEVSLGVPLVYGVYCTSVMVIDDLLYAFGGFGGAGKLNKVQYYNLSAPITNQPTLSPSTVSPTTYNSTSSMSTTKEPMITTPVTTTETTTGNTGSNGTIIDIYGNSAYTIKHIISFLIVCVDLILI